MLTFTQCQGLLQMVHQQVKRGELLVSYFLTEEQVLIKNSVRDFCQNPETLKMVMGAYQRGGFPLDCWQAAADMGFIGVSIAEEYGGQGRDLTTELLVLEEMGNNGFPIGGAIVAHNLGMLAIQYWGTEEQKQKYLVPAASGKAICCGAFTDPAGSFNFPEWGMNVTKDGSDYIINANKVMVTNAVISDIKIIFGMDPKLGDSNHAYIVEKGAEGVAGQAEQKMVPDLADWGTVSLKNVRVPEANRLNGENCKVPWLSLGFLTTAVLSHSLAQIAFVKTLAFTKQRTRYGKPLTDLQTISHRLVNMAIANETSRSLIYNAARLWDEERYEESARLCSMAKVYVTENANKTLHDATVMHGGVGFTMAPRVGPMWASSLQLEIAEGPTDLHRDLVAESYGIKPGWKDGRP